MKQGLLDEITVIDLTQMLQGPWTTQKLAEMGAEVLKIEPPGSGENARKTKMMGQEIAGENPSFHAINQQKKSVAVDVATERGRTICLELGAEADVVVHNFRPGVVEELGLAYDDFRAVNEEIIYCATSGYGRSGPYIEQDLPGQDLLVQSLGGLASMTGRADDPPTPVGVAVVDLYSGLVAAFAIALALFHRERTGRGGKVDTTLLDSALELQVQELNLALNVAEEVTRSDAGIASPIAPAPYGIYETVDGYVAIAAFGWDGSGVETLAELLDAPDIAAFDHPFEERDDIKRAIESETVTYETDDLVSSLRTEGVWCARVQTIEEVVDDEQLRQNDTFRSYHHPKAGTLETTRAPYEFSHVDVPESAPAPELGDATETVLRDLGYTAEQITTLRSDQIVE